MRVSCLIRNRNHGHFLRRAIDSALAQRGLEVEVVVVDDGSTDDSASIVASYGPRIVSYAGPHRGAVAALNTAIGASSGDAFMLLDADDWAEAGLASALAGALTDEAAFTYADYVEEAADGSSSHLVDLSVDPYAGIAASFLFRRAIVHAAGGYDETLMFAEYDLLARLLQTHRGVHVAAPAGARYHYVRHEASMTADMVAVENEIAKLRSRHGFAFCIRSYGELPIRLRAASPTNEDDARLLLDWRNEEGSRKASFRAELISWPDHWAWYQRRISAGASRIFLALEAGRPVGMIRFDVLGDLPSVSSLGTAPHANLELSIVVAPVLRGRGYGLRMLNASVELLATDGRPVTLWARIRKDNLGSLALFARAGYRHKGDEVFERIPAEWWEFVPPLRTFT